MTYVPEHLEKWTMPLNYFGAKWPDYYSSGVGRSRDSDALERSNFACMLRELGGESDTVTIVRESHWAVGWVEWIAIHESDAAALETADQIKAALEDYPIVDESHFSDLEWNEAAEYWESCSASERYSMARHELRRYHWLDGKVSPLRWANMSFHRLGNDDGHPASCVSSAIFEGLHQ